MCTFFGDLTRFGCPSKLAWTSGFSTTEINFPQFWRLETPQSKQADTASGKDTTVVQK